VRIAENEDNITRLSSALKMKRDERKTTKVSGFLAIKRSFTSMYSKKTEENDARHDENEDADAMIRSLRTELDAAVNERAELKRGLKAATVATRAAKDKLFVEFRAQERAARGETSADEIRVRRIENEMNKTIAKQAIAATRISKEEVAARKAKVEAAKALKQQQIAAVMIGRHGTVVSSKIEKHLAKINAKIDSKKAKEMQ